MSDTRLAPATIAVLAAVSLASLVPVAGAQDAQASAAPPPTVPLRLLVGEALRHNLTLRSARAITAGVETSIQAASSTFDPLIQVSPLYGRPQIEVLTGPGAVETGTQPNGAVVSGVQGTLPLSTSYAVTLQSDWQRQTNPRLLPPGAFPSTVDSTLSFTVAQPLLRGRGRDVAQGRVNEAVLGSRASVARFDRTTQQTVTDVEVAYWTLGLAEAAERIARESHARALDLMSRNEKMRALNLISEVDAITSRRGVQQRLTTLTDAVRRRKDAYERLVYMVYGDTAPERLLSDPEFRTERPASEEPHVDPVALLEASALQQRHDVQAARLDLSQVDINRNLARNALLPDARLTASYAMQTFGTNAFRLRGTSRVGDLQQSDWTVGVAFSYPIGNRASRAAYARARYDYEAQEAVVASTEVQVRSEVRAAARAIDADRERLGQAQLSFTYAQQQYEGGRKQLQLGLIDSFRLLQMEDDVSTAEQVLEQTRYDLAIAATSFRLATGTTEVDQAEQPPAGDAGSPPARRDVP